jgi:DNA-binding transcriptional LysR family regulator
VIVLFYWTIEMTYPTFDLDVLRSFALGVDLGSYARAADRLGRSTSAVSAQLKKLESQAGAPLFRKAGRGLALTAAGETLLAYARRLIELNDEAVAAIHGVAVEGWVRLGIQEDFGEQALPAILGRFARAHPKVRIEARIARNQELADRVAAGKLDLALAWGAGVEPYGERVGEVAMRWIGASDYDGAAVQSGEPLSLAALTAPCLFRTAATAALDRAGLAWRLSFESPSLGGLWAAAAAGLGVTVRTKVGVPETLRPLPDAAGLPGLPLLSLSLLRAEPNPPPATARLAAIILQELRETPPISPAAAP